MTLPAPVLDGPTALYPDVLPGVDASVEVRSGGFEVLWVVKTPEAAALLVDTYGDDAGEVVLPTRLRSKVSPVVMDEGGVGFKQLGEPVGEFVAPSMWDSSAEVPGARGEETAVAFDLAPVAQTRGAGESLRGMDVVASEEWLTAEERVFPVVIDPTYQSVSGGVAFDTWVQNGVTVDKSAAADLRIGNDGTGMVARSFMNFDASLFKGRSVRRANLSLYGSYSSTCSQTEFAAYDAGLASTSSRWAAQPALGAKRATSTSTVGQSASCPAARVSIDMTAQAQGWSSTSASQVGMMLGATNVTNAYGWKIFHSSEGQNKPAITVWFNRSPDKPVVPSIAGMVSATTSGGVKNFVGVAKPTISVPVKDADVDTVTAVISRFTSATSLTPAAELCRGTAGSGGTVKCTSVPDLPANSSVWIRATAGDGMGWSGYGPAVEVRYGGVTPTAPVISCPTSANGSWTEAVKPAETCTITAKAGIATASSPTSGGYRINGGAWTTVSFTQITADTQIATVTLGGAEGAHSVEASVTSPVGKESTKTSYVFGYGKPELISPDAVLTTSHTVEVDAWGPPMSIGAFQWRVKGSADPWRDIVGAVGTVGSTGEFSASFDLKSHLEAGSIPSNAPVVVEIRGEFTLGTAAPFYTDLAEIEWDPQLAVDEESVLAFAATLEDPSLAGPILVNQADILAAITGISLDSADVWFGDETDPADTNLYVRTLDDVLAAQLHDTLGDRVVRYREEPLGQEQARIDDALEMLATAPLNAQGAYVDVATGDVVVDAVVFGRGPIPEYDGIRINPGSEAADHVVTHGGSALGSCTVGFGATRNGVRGFLTADHCGSSQKFYSGVTASGSSGTSTRQFSSDRKNSDIAFHAVGKGHSSDFNMWAKSAAKLTAVTSPLSVPSGTVVCSRGKTTGYRCGKITSLYYKPAWANACNSGKCNANFVKVSVGTKGGDSGGPWFYNNRTPLGINKGGNTTYSVYSKISLSGCTVGMTKITC